MPETKQTGRPLSYYMRNGLWYFTQPPDALSGQVIPKSTVEQWLEKTLELEAELSRLREQVEQRITVEQAMISIEEDFFRTVEDSGAGFNAMMIWGAFRELMGYPRLKRDDLPAYDGTRYAMPPDSQLIDEMNKRLSKLTQR